MPALGAALFVATAIPAQTPSFRVRGDTSGAPAGCSASHAIVAIDAWFAAFNAADSAGFVRAIGTSRTGGWVFSTGKFTPTDTFVRFSSISGLWHYARTRALHRERITVEDVHFQGWLHRNGRALGFLIYITRSADDLGTKPLLGIGKAEYFCGQGISVLNLAPLATALRRK